MRELGLESLTREWGERVSGVKEWSERMRGFFFSFTLLTLLSPESEVSGEGVWDKRVE